jgi:OOP family OmpA-OmpF porin
MVSEKRASKVREYLVAYQNVNPSLVTSEGLGPSQPAASNATEAGRALNRRVEIAVQTGE